QPNPCCDSTEHHRIRTAGFSYLIAKPRRLLSNAFEPQSTVRACGLANGQRRDILRSVRFVVEHSQLARSSTVKRVVLGFAVLICLSVAGFGVYLALEEQRQILRTPTTSREYERCSRASSVTAVSEFSCVRHLAF